MESLRNVPVGLQGIWLGLVCIVLLVGSAAALRSLFAGNVGAGAEKPLAVAPTSTVVAAPGAPSTSGGGLGAATPPPPASATSLSIGGGSGGPGGPGFGALAIRDRLSSEVRLRRTSAFIDDLERLMDVEPNAIDRADVRRLIVDTAVYSMIAGPNGATSADGERLFTFLVTRAGPAGPDILLDLVTTRGQTRASSYAEDLLRREDVRAKGTAAFKIAYDLRAAPTCQARTALFPRVQSEGDKRVLASLFQMARCGHGPTDCCLGNDPGYKEAVRVINAKK